MHSFTGNLINEIISNPVVLSKEQKRSVISISKNNKIIAGAGAGKTEVLTRRIAYLLLVKGVDPSSIVVFTFTNKAAKNMKNRIYKRIEQIAGGESTAHLGEMYIGTIHGYAKRILEDKYDYGIHRVLDENQEMAFLMRFGWEIGLSSDKGYSKNCSDFLRTVNMVWNEMINENLLSKEVPDFYRKFKKYNTILDENKLITFGKIIHSFVMNLRNSIHAISYVKYLLVDEYQDINNSQSELIRLISAFADLFVIGDPRQSIFQWRGSNEDYFHKFKTTFADVMETELEENRRSLTKIVDVANKFAETFSISYTPLKTVRSDVGFTGLSIFNNEYEEAEWISEQIKRLTIENNLKYSDFGVLYRSVNTSASPLLKVLYKNNIPFIVGGKVGLFRRPEAQAIGRIFAWITPNGFWFNDMWNKNSEMKVIGDKLLDEALSFWKEIYKNHLFPFDAKEYLYKLRKNFDSYKFKTLIDIFNSILNILGYKNFDPNNQHDSIVMANLGRFSKLLADYEGANRMSKKRSPTWDVDLKGLCWFMNLYALQSYEEQISDDIQGINAVQIMTVHQAKGLEWSVVFLPSLTNKRFPSSMVGRRQNWFGISDKLFDIRRYEGTEEDERKLFYVALTRAKEILIMSYFTSKGTSSSFLTDIQDVVNPLLKGEKIPSLGKRSQFDSDELRTFSANDLIMYELCPQMYRFNKLWGYQIKLNENIGYGSALHFCLRKASQLKRQQGFSILSSIITAIDENFFLPYLTGEPLKRRKKDARFTLLNFANKYEKDLEKVFEVEYRLEFPLQNANMMGIIDVILKDNLEFEIREYKTSEEARTFEQAAIQVLLYVIGLRKMGRPVTSGSVGFLEENIVKDIEINKEVLKNSVKRSEKLIEGILSQNFEANPGKLCLKCDYNEICKWKYYE